VPEASDARAVQRAARDSGQSAEDRAVIHRRGNPLWAVPLSTLEGTRERPIFSSSRRPQAPPTAAVALPRVQPKMAPQPTPPQRPLLVLLGTVTGSAGGMAIFTDTTTSSVLRLHTSEAHEGWILRAVSEREATLQKEGETAVLALPPRASTAAAPAAPPRIPLPVLRRP
jgi:hypothetical protein